MVPFPEPWENAWIGYELSELAEGHTARTIKVRRSSVLCLAKRFPGKSPEQITKTDMRVHFTELRKYRKPGGILCTHNDLVSFFKFVSSDYEVPSPMDGIKRPKVDLPDVPILDGIQIAALLSTCDKSALGVRDRAILCMYMETGLRRTELISLNVEDVDIREMTAIVQKGKGGKPRIVTFGIDTSDALRRYLRFRGTEPGALFYGRGGNRLTYPGVGFVVERHGRAAGIPGLHPHILRHSWVHHALADGIGGNDLQHLAGWSSMAQLARYGRAGVTQRALAAGKKHPVLASALRKTG